MSYFLLDVDFSAAILSVVWQRKNEWFACSRGREERTANSGLLGVLTAQRCEFAIVVVTAETLYYLFSQLQSIFLQCPMFIIVSAIVNLIHLYGGPWVP